MDPLKETVRAETRRQFFGTAARGIGGLALANLFAEDAFALTTARDQVGGLPDLPHFAPKAKHCIYLHMMGRAAADGPARLQAEDEGVLRPGPARFDPPGPAPDDDDLRTVALSRSPHPPSSSPSTGRAAPGSPNSCPTRRAWRTTSRSSVPCTPTRSTTSRGSPSSRPASRSRAAPASGPGSRTALAA